MTVTRRFQLLMNLLLYVCVFFKKVLLNALSFEETSLDPALFQKQ